MALLEVKNVKKIYTTRFGSNQVEALRVVHHNNQKKRDYDFEKELADKIQEIRGEQNSGNDQTARV